MTWEEFSSLLSGLGADSPLVRIVRIRSEKDRDMLKHFTPEQHRIRNDWTKKKRSRNTGTATIQERNEFLKQLLQAFRG